MEEEEQSFTDEMDQNLEETVKKMIKTQNRKKKKSGGFQVMGML